MWALELLVSTVVPTVTRRYLSESCWELDSGFSAVSRVAHLTDEASSCQWLDGMRWLCFPYCSSTYCQDLPSSRTADVHITRWVCSGTSTSRQPCHQPRWSEHWPLHQPCWVLLEKTPRCARRGKMERRGPFWIRTSSRTCRGTSSGDPDSSSYAASAGCLSHSLDASPLSWRDNLHETIIILMRRRVSVAELFVLILFKKN